MERHVTRKWKVHLKSCCCILYFVFSHYIFQSKRTGKSGNHRWPCRANKCDRHRYINPCKGLAFMSVLEGFNFKHHPQVLQMLELHFFLAVFTPSFSTCEVGGPVWELRSGKFGNFWKIAKVVLEISCLMDLPQNFYQLFFQKPKNLWLAGSLANHWSLQGPSVAGLGSSISSGRSHVTWLGSTTTSLDRVPMSWATQMGLHKPHIFLLWNFPPMWDLFLKQNPLMF